MFGQSDGKAYETASDTFLRIAGIDGTSSDIDHVGWYDVLSHRLSLIHQGSPENWSNEHALLVAKRPDRTSPQLAMACATGVPFDSATLEVVSLRKRDTLMIYHISGCMITDYSGSFQSAPSANDTFIDHMALSFKYIDWEHFRPNEDGAPTISKSRVNRREASQPTNSLTIPKSAFIVMWMDPEHPELEDVHSAIMEVCNRFGISAVRADDIQHDDRITDIILERIRTSEIIMPILQERVPTCTTKWGMHTRWGSGRSWCEKKEPHYTSTLQYTMYGNTEMLTELRDILTKRLSTVYSEAK